MKRLFTVLLGLVLGAVLLTPAGPATAAGGPYCGIRWGSLAESDPTMSAGAWLTDIRTGRHACYDRIVFDIHGDIEGYHVAYGPIVTEGEGRTIAVRGAADLAIVLRVPAHDESGRATYPGARPRLELVDVGGYSTFRQVVFAGSFEGQTTIGLGVRARLPFRVFILDGPGDLSRLVVDVAHRW